MNTSGLIKSCGFKDFLIKTTEDLINSPFQIQFSFIKISKSLISKLVTFELCLYMVDSLLCSQAPNFFFTPEESPLESLNVKMYLSSSSSCITKHIAQGDIQMISASQKWYFIHIKVGNRILPCHFLQVFDLEYLQLVLTSFFWCIFVFPQQKNIATWYLWWCEKMLMKVLWRNYSFGM